MSLGAFLLGASNKTTKFKSLPSLYFTKLFYIFIDIFISQLINCIFVLCFPPQKAPILKTLMEKLTFCDWFWFLLHAENLEMVYNQKTPSLETGKPGHWFHIQLELAVRAWGIHLATLHLCVFGYDMRMLTWVTRMVALNCRLWVCQL